MSQSSTLSEKRDCACDSCWLARKSCDKFDPCSRCSQRGIACAFSGKGVRSKIASRKAQPKKQRKQTTTPSNYFNSGIERLTNILNERQLNSDPGTGSEADAVDRIASYISDANMLLPDDVYTHAFVISLPNIFTLMLVETIGVDLPCIFLPRKQ